MTNKELSQLLKNMSAAYLILGENRFKMIAYEKAADSIEYMTQEVKEIWEQGKLEEVPGIGKGIAVNLDELFRTGKSSHFDEVMSKVPQSIFPLLLVPGIGPKKAFKLVTTFELYNPKTVVEDLEKVALAHKIATLEGFGEKSEQVILSGIESYKKGQIKENRMSLPDADRVAQEILTYLRNHPKVKRADLLGSLRRNVATIGDIDIAVITDKPDEVVEHFIAFPHEKITDHGSKGATILLHNGRQVDLRVARNESYGAMLQYFTGSKHHNIHLRTLAIEKGLSLSEHGIKDVKTGKLKEYADEESFYEAIGLPYIPPELREDRGEVEAAIAKKLPDLIELKDINGDLHMHTNYVFPTSHDLGQSHVHDHLDMAIDLGYEYVGISDHNPKVSDLTAKDIASIMEKRYAWYKEQLTQWQKKTKKNVELFVMCEVDILVDGTLALPTEAFEFVDAVVVSLHSSFRQSKEDMTKRIIKALTTHPKVKIFGHPTGRLLMQRDGVDADWNEVMNIAKERDIALEINAYPDRLDLPDHLVREAVKKEISFTINTDSHEVNQMKLMKYGITVARRGWVQKKDVKNTLPLSSFKSWLLHT